MIDSKLIDHDGNDYRIFLRLLKKKIITVVLDTDHDVHYSALDEKRWTCRSYTTRIAEVEDAGTPKEKVLEPDTGYGFLWRLYSYWKFEEKKGGVGMAASARLRLAGAMEFISSVVHFPDPRHTAWLGLDHRAHHPQASARVADPHPEATRQGLRAAPP